MSNSKEKYFWGQKQQKKGKKYGKKIRNGHFLH
jgi:hypothetical protein